MNLTATDAIEELEQLVEIEEAGYTVVRTTHRQTYIGGIEPDPWPKKAGTCVRSSSLPAFLNFLRLSTGKAAALAAAA